MAGIGLAAAVSYLLAAEEARPGTARAQYQGVQDDGSIRLLVINSEDRPADVIDGWVRITTIAPQPQRVWRVVKLQLPPEGIQIPAKTTRAFRLYPVERSAMPVAAAFSTEFPPLLCGVSIKVRQPRWSVHLTEAGTTCRRLLLDMWPDGRAAFGHFYPNPTDNITIEQVFRLLNIADADIPK